MKKTIYLIAIFIVVLSCKENASESGVQDQQVNPEQESMDTDQTLEEDTKKDPEWVVLFDGTSTDQWRGYLSDSLPSEWTIEGDALAFNPGEEGGKNIISRETYRNFILSLEWKISEGGNSGIFWAVHEDEKYPEAYQTGPEIQVLDNERHPDAKVANGTHTAGSLYDMIAPPEDVTKPAGEWNQCLIEIDYDRNFGSVTLNGLELFQFAVKGEKWDFRVMDSKFADWEGFAKYEEGHIGLQDHSDKVWYRNIKIKSLD